MDFSIPAELLKELECFQDFIKSHLKSELSVWNKTRQIPRQFFQALGDGSWYGLESKNDDITKGSALREALRSC